MGLVTNYWKIDILIAISTLCLLLYIYIIYFSESWDRVYKKLENEKYGGFYHSIFPMLMIRDPEYINDILKTSFEHFPDRIFHVDGKTNPLDQHLFFIRGNKWRYLRSKLSPLFSQVKLKWMYEEIENCANIFDECMKEIADGKDVEMKELLARCTTDVIYFLDNSF
ncbi:cytochrome P450 6k1-like [Halyomorpha halys]|uniref:cytochrome P450 6k1-like n=1 Tax=Halyomorpha halys TaxID=286706 RepID=UPI0034D2D482